MFRNRRRTRLGRVGVAGAAAVLAAGIAGCTSSPGPSGGGASPSASSTAPAAPGGTATVALSAGVSLNYIWPFVPPSAASEYNTRQFQQLMYRPLYVFGSDNGSSVSVNYRLSPAYDPVYSPDGKTVTINMKGWKWSDGEAVNASDVVFWLNMMNAEPGNYYGTAAGQLPYNLASYRATSASTVVLHLMAPASSIWFTYNQLAEITPMPAAWDVSSASATPGSGGCATDSPADNWAKCTAVYDFMSAQAKNVKTYATNPVWSVVDGPWKLSSYSGASSGAVTSFVPNAGYSGSPKPQLDRVTYYAYTSDRAEYAALKAGQVDIGQVPDQDLAPVSGGRVLPSNNPLGSGFNLQPWYPYSVEYYEINFNNPALGPAFRQLYVRQALQELVDQERMVSAVQRGYAYPTTGGVPSQPANQWTPAIETANGGQGPYPFSVVNATALLASHGWRDAGGTMTCENPSLCGAGIAAGTKLAFTMDYATGVTYLQQEAAILRSDLAQAGIQLKLVPQPLGTILGESRPCAPAATACDWQALYFGGRNFSGPGFEPTGEPLFQTGSASNAGGYSDPQENNLINLTHTSNSLSVFQQYATYTAQQLPGVIFTPNHYNVMAVNSRLANVGFNPLATVLPEFWNFTR